MFQCVQSILKPINTRFTKNKSDIFIFYADMVRICGSVSRFSGLAKL